MSASHRASDSIQRNQTGSWRDLTFTIAALAVLSIEGYRELLRIRFLRQLSTSQVLQREFFVGNNPMPVQRGSQGRKHFWIAQSERVQNYIDPFPVLSTTYTTGMKLESHPA